MNTFNSVNHKLINFFSAEARINKVLRNFISDLNTDIYIGSRYVKQQLLTTKCPYVE